MGLPFRLEATAGGEAGRLHALLPSAPTLRPLSLRTAKDRISRIPAFPSILHGSARARPLLCIFIRVHLGPGADVFGFSDLKAFSDRNIDYYNSGFKAKIEEIILHLRFV
jgi:hypothetical protein